MKKNAKSVLFITLVIFALLFLSANYFLRHEITSEELTRTAIGETFYRIHLFMKQEDKVPATFYQLPIRSGYANNTKDAWDRELVYSISGEGVLSLLSYGADNKLGGTDQNKDIEVKYETLDAAGRSIIQDNYWIVNAEIKADKFKPH